MLKSDRFGMETKKIDFLNFLKIKLKSDRFGMETHFLLNLLF